MTAKRICTECVLTEGTPGILFDENGVCNYCKTYKPMEVQGEEKLIELLNSFKAKGKSYDCMVGLSGGRDSTYTLWKLVNDYNMKVLVMNYKSPFASEQARKNIQRAVEILKVDMVDWEFPNDAHRKTTKKHLGIWAHNPSSIMIPFVCAICKSPVPYLTKIMRENNTSLLVLGSNPLETASFKSAGFGGARTYHSLKNLPSIAYKSIKQIISNPWYLTANWPLVLKMYLQASHSTPYSKWLFRDMKVVRLFDYIKWNEKDVEFTIIKNLGWEKSPEVESSWRFDCRLDYVRRIMYASTVGVTELRDLFSKMIREKQLTREEALDRLEKEDHIPETLAEEILGSLGMKLSDLHLDVDQDYLI